MLSCIIVLTLAVLQSANNKRCKQLERAVWSIETESRKDKRKKVQGHFILNKNNQPSFLQTVQLLSLLLFSQQGEYYSCDTASEIMLWKLLMTRKKGTKQQGDFTKVCRQLSSANISFSAGVSNHYLTIANLIKRQCTSKVLLMLPWHPQHRLSGCFLQQQQSRDESQAQPGACGDANFFALPCNVPEEKE